MNIGLTNGIASLGTLYLRAGNEGATGDTVTATLSSEMRLLLDGGDPVQGAGIDTLIITNTTLVPSAPSDPTFPVPRTSVVDPDTLSRLEFWNFETAPTAKKVRTTVAIAPGLNSGGVVYVYAPKNLTLRYAVKPYSDFTGDIHVATADINGDGIDDVIVAPGEGGGPRVLIFDGRTGTKLYDLFVFEQNFRGGVWVAGGDFNRDGFAELVVGAGAGGGPRVRVIDLRTMTVMHDFMAFELNFRGGVQVGMGDLDRDGFADLFLAAGPGGGPRVVIRNGQELSQIMFDRHVFEMSFNGGVNLAVGDVDGDGFADIIVGRGRGAPQVRVFSGHQNIEIANFYVNDVVAPNQQSNVGGQQGVRVGVGDFNGDGLEDVFTSRGRGSRTTLRTFRIAAIFPDGSVSRAFDQLDLRNPYTTEAVNGLFIG